MYPRPHADSTSLHCRFSVAYACKVAIFLISLSSLENLGKTGLHGRFSRRHLLRYLHQIGAADQVHKLPMQRKPIRHCRRAKLFGERSHCLDAGGSAQTRVVHTRVRLDAASRVAPSPRSMGSIDVGNCTSGLSSEKAARSVGASPVCSHGGDRE